MAYVTGLTKKATQGHGLSLEDLMNEDRTAGTARNLGGKAEEGVGRVTGDIKEQVQGKLDRAAGAAQDLYGQTADVAISST